MSQADVEVVRQLNAPYEGVDLVPFIRDYVERFGPDPDEDAVLAASAEDPSWRHFHPDIEWEASVPGLPSSVHGIRELAMWWGEWVEAWESYEARMLEYRDLGDWILVPADVRARGRGGIDVEMRTFQLYRVRDGKVAVYRVFLSEREALHAAGLAERAP